MLVLWATGSRARRFGAGLATAFLFAAEATGADGDARSRTAFGVEASVGEQRSNLESLNRAIAPYAYSPFASTAWTIGVDAYAVGSRVRVGARIDVLTDRRSRAPGAELGAREVLALAEFGYHLWEHDRAALFPYLGVGFDRLVLTPERGNLPLPRALAGHRSVVRDALALDLGLGLATSIPFAEWHLPGERPIDKESCISVGARIGYLFTAFPSSYGYVDAPSNRVDAPRAYTGGYYFRVSVGWVVAEQTLEPCAERCPVAPHAKPWCTSGTCSYVCLGDFGDCDNVRENGCETPLDTDQNCGGCGVVCGDLGHGHTRCVGTPGGPACVVTHCDPGYASCNGRPEDGCEANLDRDRLNCGACGDRCRPGQMCVRGRCRSPRSD